MRTPSLRCTAGIPSTVGIFLLAIFPRVVTGTANESNAKIVSGTFALPEISGAVFVDNRLLLAADDPEGGKGFHMVDLIEGAPSRLAAGTQIVAAEKEQIYHDILFALKTGNDGELDSKLIADLEDIAASAQGDYYLISSHSRNKKDELPQKRQQLVRVRFDTNGKVTNAVLSSKSLFDALPKNLQDSAKLRPGSRDSAGNYTPGLNIEGLAWAPENDLLIGLRSPLVESKAVVLRLKSVAPLFDHVNGPSGTDPVTIEATLDLGGMGIRGMCYDEKEKAYWLIAGIAPDPDTPDEHLPNEWAIWFWDSTQHLHRRWDKHDLPKGARLDNPEAICVLRSANGDYSLLLISDDDKNAASSYVLVPQSQLK